MEEKKNIPQEINPIQVAINVTTPIDEVWAVITRPDLMRQWFFDIDQDVLEDGTAFQFTTDVKEKPVLHECLILEMEKPSKLRYTWAYPEISQGSSTVNWDLEDDGDGTDIIVTHETVHELLDSGIILSQDMFMALWKDLLSNKLKPYLEGRTS